MYKLKEYFINELLKINGVYINGINGVSIKDTSPSIISVSVEGIRSEVLLNSLSENNIYVSSGSACSSNHPSLSGTLKAINLKDNLLDSTIRFSLCVNSNKEEIDYTISVLKELICKLRKYIRK